MTSLLLLLWFGQASKAPATIAKAALAAEATNDQKLVLVPPKGQTFLWVSAKLASPQTIDLTKVAIVSGAMTSPLIGVDSAWDGDPKQFSMIAPATLKTGKPIDPLEETRSVGTIAFAFTPLKTATLKVNDASAAFCLLFVVPPTFTVGQLRGMGPDVQITIVKGR